MHPAFLFLSIIAMLAVGCQCSLPPLHTDNEINIVSYNVHNLFDAEESGKEYPEFRPSKGNWTKELYAKRLENVVEAVRSIQRDGHVLVETQWAAGGALRLQEFVRGGRHR